MLSFTKNKKDLLLTYYPDNPWVVTKIENGDEILLKKRTFIFTSTDVYSSEIDGNESESKRLYHDPKIRVIRNPNPLLGA